MVRHLLADDDLSAEEVKRLFTLASELKSRPVQPLLPSKNLAMLFTQPSTRTRVSFEVAMNQLGGSALNLSAEDLQLRRGESLIDAGKNLSRYVDLIVARVQSQKDLEEIAKNSRVPVINGMTDSWHPCQALADIFTVKEKKGLENVKIAFVGDGNSPFCRSLIRLTSKLGVLLTVASPKDFSPSKDVLKGTKVKVTQKPKDAVKGADVVITCGWVIPSKDFEAEDRKAVFKPFQVNAALMKAAKKDAIFLHPLPAHRGEEVTSEVLDGKQSVAFDQAENRMHVQKALMVQLLR